MKRRIVISVIFIFITNCVSIVKAQNLKSPPLFNAPDLAVTETVSPVKAHAELKTADPIVLSKNDNYYLPLSQLAERITKGAISSRSRIDSIFLWIVMNIDYDEEAYLQNTYGRDDPGEVIGKGKAICTGFSNLFASLCRLNGFDARVVTGYARGAGCGDRTRFELPNHAWNAVKIDGRWYLADVSWASAYRMHLWKNCPDKRGRALSLSVFRDYYPARPDVFIMDHLPEDPVWQLLDHPVSLTAFEKGKRFIKIELQDTTRVSFDYAAEIKHTEKLDSLDRNIRMLERSVENQFNQYREYNLGVAYYYKACRLATDALRLSSPMGDAVAREAGALFKKSYSLLSSLNSDAPDYHFAVLLAGNIKSRIRSCDMLTVY